MSESTAAMSSRSSLGVERPCACHQRERSADERAACVFPPTTSATKMRRWLDSSRQILGEELHRVLPVAVRALAVKAKARKPRRLVPGIHPAKFSRKRYQDSRVLSEAGSDVHIRVAHSDVFIHHAQQGSHFFKGTVGKG